MKVVYINHSSGIQGAGLALLNIVIGMLNLGVIPIVVLPREGILLEKFLALGVKVYLVKNYNELYPRKKTITDCILYPYRFFRTVFFNKIAERKLRKIVEYEHPDIIHSNTGVIRFASKVADKLKIPHVWHIREFQSKLFLGEPLGGETTLTNLFHFNNNHCIAITKAVFQHFNLDEKKDFVIYDGVFSQNVKIPNITGKKKYILFVGSLQKGKGILDALYAFDSIANKISEYEFLIAGNDYIDIKYQISKCKNSCQIKYLGFRTDVYELMAQSTALLVPSFYEGFGFTTVEAMLNKTIVIGRDVAGTKEQFDNGLRFSGNEIGIRFNTKEELANAILNVCNGSLQSCQSMIDEAYKVVMHNYTIESNTSRILNAYERILCK